MAATKYQILYHAVNRNSGSMPIVNDTSVSDELKEFYAEYYHAKHKMNAENIFEKIRTGGRTSVDGQAYYGCGVNSKFPPVGYEKYEYISEKDLIPESDLHKECKEHTEECVNAYNALLVERNAPDCPKYGMLYVYNGMKAYYRRDWILKKMGWLVKNYKDYSYETFIDSTNRKIKELITNTNMSSPDGDYTGEFLLFNAPTSYKHENAVVVSQKNPILRIYGAGGLKQNISMAGKNQHGAYEIVDMKQARNYNPADMGYTSYYTFDEIKSLFFRNTYGEIDYIQYPLDPNPYYNFEPNQVAKTDWSMYFQTDTTQDILTRWGIERFAYNMNVFINHNNPTSLRPLVITVNQSVPNGIIYLRSMELKDYILNHADTLRPQYGVTRVHLLPEHMQTYPIPAHWLPSDEPPYVATDTYKPIDGDPWFEYTTVGSFQKALEICEQLAKKIGLENINLIKVVPTDEFIKVV